MYGTPTCPTVPAARGMLERSGASFDYVNINQDEDGRQQVQAINNGYLSVPTLVFADGSTLTEPSQVELRQKLESLGYDVTPPTLWQSLRERPLYALLGVGVLLLGIYQRDALLIGMGVVALGTVVLMSRL